MAEIFSKLIKDINLQFENVQQILSRINRNDPYQDNTVEQ